MTDVIEVNVATGERSTRPYTEKERKGFIKDVPTPFQELRLLKYRNGDYIDALMKDANLRRLNGEDVNEDLDNALNHWLSVKAEHPKE